MGKATVREADAIAGPGYSLTIKASNEIAADPQLQITLDPGERGWVGDDARVYLDYGRLGGLLSDLPPAALAAMGVQKIGAAWGASPSTKAGLTIDQIQEAAQIWSEAQEARDRHAGIGENGHSATYFNGVHIRVENAALRRALVAAIFNGLNELLGMGIDIPTMEEFMRQEPSEPCF